MKSYKRRNRRTKSVWLAVFLLAICLFSGCGQNAGQQEEKARYIAVICKGSQHEFWKSVEQGAMDAGEELNIRVTFDAPEDESQIDAQIDMVEEAITNHADAIVLAPLDTERLNDVIDKAATQGIPVLTLDSDVTTTKRVATIGTDNESAGAIAARNAASLMGGKGQVAIVAHVEGAQTCIARQKGFTDEMASKYKNKIEIVGVTYCEGDSELAKEQALAFIEQNPNLKCIYGTNEGAAVGIAAAVAQKHMEDKIFVIGFDSSDAEVTYLENNIIDGIVVQNPYNMGYLGVRNVSKVLDGKTIEEKFDTGATYVNAENLKDEDTQWILYPLGKKED